MFPQDEDDDEPTPSMDAGRRAEGAETGPEGEAEGDLPEEDDETPEEQYGLEIGIWRWADGMMVKELGETQTVGDLVDTEDEAIEALRRLTDLAAFGERALRILTHGPDHAREDLITDAARDLGLLED
jgi:hypothetical protein